MALSFTFNFGRLLGRNERVTTAKLNAIVKGITGSLTGSVGNADLAAAAVDPTKVAPGAYWYALGSLAGSTYTAAFTPAVTGYSDGLVVAFKASAGNTGGVNLDAGAGAKSLRKWGGKPLETGDIVTGDIVNCRFNSTLVGGGCWEVAAPPAQPARDDYRYVATTGTGTSPTAYAGSLANAPAAYTAGLAVKFTVDTANTGGATLNLNALGAKSVVKTDGSALVSNELMPGRIVVAVFDGTNFVVVGPLNSYKPAEGVTGTVKGLVIANNTGTPNTKVDVAGDEIVLKSAAGQTVLGQPVAVTIDATVSGAANGLDAGGLAASTWYYIWLISDGTTVAGLLSLSSTAPTLPGVFTFKALVGTVVTDATSHFRSFYQTGKRVMIVDTNIFNATTGVTAWTQLSGAALTAYQAVVPPIATGLSGNAGASTTSVRMMEVSGDSNGLGAYACHGAGAPAINSVSGSGYRIVLRPATAPYYKMADTGANYGLNVSGYEL